MLTGNGLCYIKYADTKNLEPIVVLEHDRNLLRVLGFVCERQFQRKVYLKKNCMKRKHKDYTNHPTTLNGVVKAWDLRARLE